MASRTRIAASLSLCCVVTDCHDCLDGFFAFDGIHDDNAMIRLVKRVDECAFPRLFREFDELGP
ncbi:MAG: hypothetical protein V4724_07440 [Pseudomonadota bacterium]